MKISKSELRRLVDYLAGKGWTAQDILDLIVNISE